MVCIFLKAPEATRLSEKADWGLLPGDTSGSTGLDTVHHIDTSRGGMLNLLYVGNPREKGAETDLHHRQTKSVHLLHFDSPVPSMDAVQDTLRKKGWAVSEHSLPFEDLPPESTVLITDEIDHPILSALADEQFTALRGLLEKQCRVVWVTRG
jgi:hypothetical protein